jgi:outer membrane lipopolysaccharide assembly protein LptE/RlpB
MRRFIPSLCRGGFRPPSLLLERLFFFAPILAALLFGGCGYHVAGHNNSLPKTIHVIAVPAMENKTTTFRIEQRLTAATIHEFLSKTTYRVVSDPNAGDAVLRGKILSVDIVPLTFQSTNTSNNVQATSMLITMKCEVTLTDRESGKVLFHTDNYLFRNEYELSSDVKSFFQESDPAFERMSQDFASRLVAAVTENY